jgi:hypothetical protein
VFLIANIFNQPCYKQVRPNPTRVEPPDYENRQLTPYGLLHHAGKGLQGQNALAYLLWSFMEVEKSFKNFG